MITLCIDTSFYYLTLVLLKDQVMVDHFYIECFKNQSELIVGKIDELLTKNNIKSNEIDEMVITKGPGSYTGVRIAMSVAKVYCSQKNIPLYTLSTLNLYAGIKDCIVLMDARANRGFVGVYSKGEIVLNDQFLELSEVKDLVEKYPDYELYGDGQLIGLEKNLEDISSHFGLLRDKWVKVENIHSLLPEYLKEQDSYGNH